MRTTGEPTSVGWGVYVLGYVAAAPWGFLAAAVVVGAVLFVGGLLLGLAVADAATRAAIGVALTGAPGGIMRYCYRRRLRRAWDRLRRGQLRP